MKKLILIGASALLALSASACGRMADLEAPGPRQTERAPRDRWAGDLPDTATVNRPSTQTPIDGGPTNPFGSSAAQSGPQ